MSRNICIKEDKDEDGLTRIMLTVPDDFVRFTGRIKYETNKYDDETRLYYEIESLRERRKLTNPWYFLWFARLVDVQESSVEWIDDYRFDLFTETITSC